MPVSATEHPPVAAESRDAGAGGPRPPLVSVILPCLNEEAGVAGCVEAATAALTAMKVDGEVVVVDNGSTDRSASLAAAAGARVVAEPRPGYGAAYLRGFQEARGRVLVLCDADGSYDLADLPRFVGPLLAGRADFVIGNRLGGTMVPGSMPWSHRFVGNPILSGLLRLLFGARVADSHCGLRALTADACRRLTLSTTGMELASEMVVAALREGLRIDEVAITYLPRKGESKLHPMRDAWRHVRFMLVLAPSHLFQLPGVALMVVGAALCLLLAAGPRVVFGRRLDVHPLLFGAFAVILGYSLVLFDLFAKTFAWGAGLIRPRRGLVRLLRAFTLERGLALGALLLIAGLAGEAEIVFSWIAGGYGELAAVRGVVLGATGMVLGLQTIAASFLVSLLLIPRREGPRWR